MGLETAEEKLRRFTWTESHQKHWRPLSSGLRAKHPESHLWPGLNIQVLMLRGHTAAQVTACVIPFLQTESQKAYGNSKAKELAERAQTQVCCVASMHSSKGHVEATRHKFREGLTR